MLGNIVDRKTSRRRKSIRIFPTKILRIKSRPNIFNTVRIFPTLSEYFQPPVNCLFLRVCRSNKKPLLRPRLTPTLCGLFFYSNMTEKFRRESFTTYDQFWQSYKDQSTRIPSRKNFFLLDGHSLIYVVVQVDIQCTLKLSQADLVLSRVLTPSIKFFLQMIFLLVLERMGQCWKKWDNVGKNGTTFKAFFVPFFPTPLYFKS